MKRHGLLHRLPDSLRQKWSAALRSGQFEQGQGALCNPGHGGDPDTFCCLGVLSKVLGLSIQRGQGLIFGRDLKARGIEVQPALDAQLEFSSLNDDHGWTFEQIADYIDGKVQHPSEDWR